MKHIWEKEMGKGDGKRIGRQSNGTVGVMVDRLEGGKGEKEVESESAWNNRTMI